MAAKSRFMRMSSTEEQTEDDSDVYLLQDQLRHVNLDAQHDGDDNLTVISLSRASTYYPPANYRDKKKDGKATPKKGKRTPRKTPVKESPLKYSGDEPARTSGKTTPRKRLFDEGEPQSTEQSKDVSAQQIKSPEERISQKNDSISAWKHRRDAYHRSRQIIRQEFKSIHKSIYDHLIMSMVDFVHRHNPGVSVIGGDTQSTTSTSSSLLAKRLNLIPTALVHLGTSISDHNELFALLEDELAKQSTFLPNLLVRLTSHSSDSLSHILLTIYERVTGQYDVDNQDEEEPNSKSSNQQNRRSKKRFISYSQLVKMYEKLLKMINLKTKRGDSNQVIDTKLPLVLIIEDVESVQSTILNDFFLLASPHQSQLPLVVMLCSPSQMTPSINTLLPHRSSSQVLALEHFQTSPPSNYIDDLIRKCFLQTELPLKFGPKLIEFTMDLLFFHDFSLRNAQLLMEQILFEFYFNGQLSHWVTNDIKAQQCHIEDCSELDIDLVRTLPSVKSNAAIVKNLQDKAMKKWIGSKMTSLAVSYDHFIHTLSVLYDLTSSLPGHPLGKTFRQLYIDAVDRRSGFLTSRSFKHAFHRFETLSIDEWCVALKRAVNNSACGSLKSAQLDGCQLCQWIHSSDTDLEVLQSYAASETIPKTRIGNTPTKRQQQPSFAEFKKLNIPALKEILTGDETTRLGSPMSLPLSELCFYNGTTRVKDYHFMSSRSQLVKTLRDPLSQLGLKDTREELLQQNTNNSKSKSSTSTSAPEPEVDISIVFSIYESHASSSINVREWLHSFVSCLSDETDKDGHKSSVKDNGHDQDDEEPVPELPKTRKSIIVKKNANTTTSQTGSPPKRSKPRKSVTWKEPSPEKKRLQANVTSKRELTDEKLARFLNALTDLEYCGVVQSLKRKRNYIAKLIWQS